MPEGQDDAREKTITNIKDFLRKSTRGSLILEEYTLFAGGVTSIDVRRRHTGKEFAMRDFIFENSLNSEDVVFIGNLDRFAQDLPLGSSGSAWRI